MLIEKLGCIVDLVVNNHVQAILGIVSGNVLVGKLGGHSGGNFEERIAMEKSYSGP